VRRHAAVALVVVALLAVACSSDADDDDRIERIDEPAQVDPDADVSGG